MKVNIGPYVPWYTGHRLESWYTKRRHKKPYWEVSLSEGDRLDRMVHYTINWIIFPILRHTVNRFFEWKGRKIKIRIDKYDTWNMDHTLALIIHPMLVQLKRKKHGSPFVDDEDVPEELRSTSARELTHEEKENGHTDDNHFKRWDYVLTEMVYAFETLKNDNWEDKFHTGEIDHVFEEDGEYNGQKMYSVKHGPKHTHVFDKESYDKEMTRIQNSLRLFGKYYMNLWD